MFTKVNVTNKDQSGFEIANFEWVCELCGGGVARCHWFYQICACSSLSHTLRVSADCGIVDGVHVRSGHQMLLREGYQKPSCVRLASWGL